MKIQKNRFVDRFDYALDCPKELEEQLVPRMLLQPIVENAFLTGWRIRSTVWCVFSRRETETGLGLP